MILNILFVVSLRFKIYFFNLFIWRNQQQRGNEFEVGDEVFMDECAAAMVLMSLSCSPKSPRFFRGMFAFCLVWFLLLLQFQPNFVLGKVLPFVWDVACHLKKCFLHRFTSTFDYFYTCWSLFCVFCFII